MIEYGRREVMEKKQSTTVSASVRAKGGRRRVESKRMRRR